MFGAIGLTFFAYAGYGTMANAGRAVENPGRTIARAIFLAIGVTIVLYVGLSLVLLGNVSPAELAKYADTAVAQAAKPIFGQIGFAMVSIAALLATASAINGTLFGALAHRRGHGEERPVSGRVQRSCLAELDRRHSRPASSASSRSRSLSTSASSRAPQA